MDQTVESNLDFDNAELHIPAKDGGEATVLCGPLDALQQIRFIPLPKRESYPSLNAGILHIPESLGGPKDIEASSLDGELDAITTQMYEAIIDRSLGRRDRRDEAEQVAAPTGEQIYALADLICDVFSVPEGRDDSISANLVHIRTYDVRDVILNGHFDIWKLAEILLRDYVKR